MLGFVEFNLLREPTGQVLISTNAITSVRPHTEKDYSTPPNIYNGVEVEYVGNAGYHTRHDFVVGTYDEVKQKIEEAMKCDKNA